jgi:hypothetical protein
MVKLLIAFASAAFLLPPGSPGPGTPSPSPSTAATPTRLAQVRIQQHIVIRVPRPDPVRRAAAPPPAPLPPIDWVEKRTDDCVSTDALSGAAIIRSDSVDLVLSGGRRVRAKLGSECPALDFYAGFYVKPNKDGKLCAKRDVFRSRAGGECRIRSFRTLIPGR